MEIKRLGENKIRCALSEQEISEMGFSIDDIIGNTETTQKFMRVVLERVEEQENINLDGISPMVKAELLQDHSMAITFGGDSESNFKNLVDTVNHLMSQLQPDKMKEFHDMNLEEKKQKIDEFLQGFKAADNEENAAFDDIDPDTEAFKETMPFGLIFSKLDDVIRFAGLFGGAKRLPENALYKLESHYYLLMDFINFSKEELRPLAFASVEFDDAHFAESLQIAYLKEHGQVIIKEQALQTLMQL